LKQLLISFLAGYLPNASTYSPPRPGAVSRVTQGHARSSSSPPTHTIRHHSPNGFTASSMNQHLSDTHYNTDHLTPRSMEHASHHYSPRVDYDSMSSSTYASTRPFSLSHVPSTPPTKDYSSTTKYTSPSTGARR